MKQVDALRYPRSFLAGLRAAWQYTPAPQYPDRTDAIVRAYLFGHYVGYRWQCWHYRHEH